MTIENLIPSEIQIRLFDLQADLYAIEAISYADDVRFGWQHEVREAECPSCCSPFQQRYANQFFCETCFNELADLAMNEDDLPF